MISDRLWVSAGIIFSSTAALGVMPYTWDKSRRTVVPSGHSHVLIRIHIAEILLYLLFLVCQCLFFRFSKDYASFSLVFATLLSTSLPMASFYMMTSTQDECMTLCNFIVYYLQYMNRKYMPHYDPNKAKFTRVAEFGALAIFTGYAIVYAIFLVALYHFPHKPFSLGNLIPPDAPPIVKIPFCYGFNAFYVLIIILNLFTIMLGFFAYGIFILPFAVRELRMGRDRYQSVDEVREPENLILAYRGIQVLQQQVTIVTGHLLFPTEALITKLIIFCVYITIKFSKEIDTAVLILIFSWGGMACTFWGSILLMGGCLHFYGTKVINSWKYYSWPDKYKRKLMSKFRKSCKPLQFNYGKTYVIKRLSVLKFLRSLSRGILRTLLAL